MRRRQLFEAAALAAGALVYPRGTLGQSAAGSRRSATTQRILVLGGTNFVGPAIVAEAIERGHEVTLFNRGITRPYLFPELEALRGVRDPGGGDLTALMGRRRWDAIVDVWAQEATLVEQTATLLRDRADHYVYVSSIAAYQDYSRPGLTEDDPVRVPGAGDYGARKVAGERVAALAFPGRTCVARCPAITGPFDPSPTYHFWLRRLAEREQVLAPGNGNDPVQLLDARDLATWVLDSVEDRRDGVFNLTGTWPPPSFRELLTATRTGIGSDAELVWMDADFVRRDLGLRSFVDLPFWAPLDEDEGFYQIDGSRALAAGARYRPLEDTARDTWRWFRSHFFHDMRFPVQGRGISAQREDEAVGAWLQRVPA